MSAIQDGIERNQTGQAMGAKGRITRLRLMAAATRLLGNNTLATLRVADIATTAGTSTAAFYRYFTDAADIVLAVAESCTQSTAELVQMVAADWPAETAADSAVAFVKTYFDTWEGNAAVLRVRNLAAEAGDRRFYAARERAVRPLQDALAARLGRSHQGRPPASGLVPQATAGALIALLERMAAVARYPHEPPVITYDALVHSTAYILARAVGPEPLP